MEHRTFKSWENVEMYKDEVLPYVKLDVMGLKELFEIFNDQIYEIEGTNITGFLTCSHMGYCIWQNMLDKIVEIPKDLEKMDYIAKAVYGGRCYPHQQHYKSKHYDAVKSGEMKYAEVIADKSKDFIFNADASSLYPASMSGFDHMEVEYPLGYSRWSDEPLKEFRDKKMGFYEIRFSPPKDIRIPVLPRRKMLGERKIGVTWSLEDGEGVYTSVDILNAHEAGYRIKFIGKALVYDESGDVFSKYIKRFYKLKERAEKDGNRAMRGIAKLLLNSLYGKMLMAPIDSHTEIINNAIELDNFTWKFNLDDYQIIN
ncbi:MAG: DNA polymerase, partial [Gammaproteobacteria bacterium]|nr:DNA polymerase [Gammaproteobacteria bacterium]